MPVPTYMAYLSFCCGLGDRVVCPLISVDPVHAKVSLGKTFNPKKPDGQPSVIQ